MAPPMPSPAPLLVDLKRRLNIRATVDPNTDDQLQHCLNVAEAWVDERVYVDPDQVPGQLHYPVVEAILLLASRLYARKIHPGGDRRLGGEVGITRIIGEDPDLTRLLEMHIDWTKAGVA